MIPLSFVHPMRDSAPICSGQTSSFDRRFDEVSTVGFLSSSSFVASAAVASATLAVAALLFQGTGLAELLTTWQASVAPTMLVSAALVGVCAVRHITLHRRGGAYECTDGGSRYPLIGTTSVAKLHRPPPTALTNGFAVAQPVGLSKDRHTQLRGGLGGIHAGRASISRATATVTTAASAVATGNDEGGDGGQDALVGDVKVKSPLLKTLVERGFLHQATQIEQLDEHLCTEGRSAYVGFDATASSLHVGSLLPLMMMRHVQKHGHKPVLLVGGGTTKIGDPSGKDQSRKMLTVEMIQSNLNGIQKVFERFVDFGTGNGATDAVVVNNDDWLSPLRYLDFLREFGPLFTINRMLNQESVRLRLAREQPLTLLEFNYSVLQAYDFFALRRERGVSIQVGGSDQWGNIVGGVELCRRIDQEQVFGVTMPLLTTADGKKMGKSEAGAVWLSAELLSPFDYWQFWRNTADADVGRFLKLFTEIDMDEIRKLEQLKGQALNDAKIVLADECTKLLHGEDKLSEVKAAVAATFGGGGAGKGGSEDRSALDRFDVTPESLSEFESDGGGSAVAGVAVVDAVVSLGFAKSKGEARRLVQGGGVRVNGEKLVVVDNAAAQVEEGCRPAWGMHGGVITVEDLEADGGALLSVGKKKRGVVGFAAS